MRPVRTIAEVDGWEERLGQHRWVEHLLDADQTVILLLARGDSRREALCRSLPESCFGPGVGPQRTELELAPLFLLGEKSARSYGRPDELIASSRFQASLLPEVRSDREFFRELVAAALDEQRIKAARRESDDLLQGLQRDDPIQEVQTWPDVVQEAFYERLLMIMHFDQKHFRRWRQYSCAVSLAKGPGRYDYAASFVDGRMGIIIDAFVRRCDAEMFVEAGKLDRLRVPASGVEWRFEFDPGGHSRQEVLVRRALFPHNVVGATIIERVNSRWRVLRYVPNPWLEGARSLQDDIHIPQRERIDRSLQAYRALADQLRLIYAQTGVSQPRYDAPATGTYLGSRENPRRRTS
jgi:hypothetical protein